MVNNNFMGMREELFSGEIAFSMEFCLETKTADNIDDATAAQAVVKAFEDFFGEGIIANTFEAHPSIAASKDLLFTLTEAGYDDDNFGDPDNIDVTRHFFSIIGRPMPKNAFQKAIMEVSDILTGKGFKTIAYTDCVIHFNRDDLAENISFLALALNANEDEWLETAGRSKGVICHDTNWTKVTLRERLALEFFKDPASAQFNQSTPLDQWRHELDRIAHRLMQSESCQSTITFNHDTKGIEFAHLGGENYQDDALPIVTATDQMIVAGNLSFVEDEDEFWASADMQAKLEGYVAYIMKIAGIAGKLEYFQAQMGTTLPTYRIFFDEAEICVASKFASGEAADQDSFDHCLLKAGALTEYVVDGSIWRQTAAMLFLKTLGAVNA